MSVFLMIWFLSSSLVSFGGLCALSTPHSHLVARYLTRPAPPVNRAKGFALCVGQGNDMLILLQFAFKLKMKDDLLDLFREIPTRRRVGIVFSIVKSNHNKFPKNPYYRCMLAWNSLPLDISLLDSKESLSKAAKYTVHSPYI